MTGRLLRFLALSVVVVTSAVVVLLPGSGSCPRAPGELDCFATSSAFTIPRAIAVVTGLLITLALLVLAALRDMQQR
jgi:hypothetical protein